MGWLESARRANIADRIAEANPAGTASAQVRDRVTSGAARNAHVDEDEDQLAAYNDYLARINSARIRAAPPNSGSVTQITYNARLRLWPHVVASHGCFCCER